MSTSTRDRWNAEAKKLLVGRTIVEARYMTPEEASAAGWDSQPVFLTLDDGTQFWPSSDDEGNDAGALHVVRPNDTDLSGLPVLRD